MGFLDNEIEECLPAEFVGHGEGIGLVDPHQRGMDGEALVEAERERAVGDGGKRVELYEMIVAEPRLPIGVERDERSADARAPIQFDPVALAILETDGLHASKARQRPSQADGGVLPENSTRAASAMVTR